MSTMLSTPITTDGHYWADGYYWCTDKESDAWIIVFVIDGKFVLETGSPDRFPIDNYKNYHGPLLNPEMEVSDE